MSLLSNSRRGGIWTWLLYAIMIGAVVYFYLNRDTTPSAREVAESQQLDPEAAVKHYLTVAYKFDHLEAGGSFDDVRLTITKGDWEWYQANVDKLKFDPFNLTGAIDPNQGEALAKRGALLNLFHAGPCHPGAEVVKKMVADTESTITLKYDTSGFKTYVERDVHVVKEDDLWKVEGFAGARAMSGI